MGCLWETLYSLYGRYCGKFLGDIIESLWETSQSLYGRHHSLYGRHHRVFMGDITEFLWKTLQGLYGRYRRPFIRNITGPLWETMGMDLLQGSCRFPITVFGTDTRIESYIKYDTPYLYPHPLQGPTREIRCSDSNEEQRT